jgi:Domain of unknown function (DUF6438)
MKLIVLFLFLSPAIVAAQHLDRIQTKRQVEEYIVKNLKYNNLKYDGFTVQETDSANVDVFKKGDFNHDGAKDIFVFGTAQITEFGQAHEMDEMLIILGDEQKPKKAEFSFKYFSETMSSSTPYPRVIRKSAKDYIAIRYDILDKHERVIGTDVDTMYVEDDRFMIYTAAPDRLGITSIEYKTSPCSGKCPVFEFSIDQTLQVIYNGIDNVNKKGEFKLTADLKDWDYMRDMLNNSRATKMNAAYSNNSKGEQTGYLTIHYKNGETKKIQDYGLAGTLGLSILFDFFQEMIRF